MLILELSYNFYTKIFGVNKLEEMKMDTILLYLALAEKEIEDCIRLEMKTATERLRLKDCSASFTCDAAGKFFPRICSDKHKKNKTKESMDSSKGVEKYGDVLFMLQDLLLLWCYLKKMKIQ